MMTKKYAEKLTPVQVQQKLLHYKAEAKKYMSQVQKMETQYDVKKIDEMLEKYQDLKHKKIKAENNYDELLKKNESILIVLKKLEERNEQLEKTLKEVERIKNELEDEKKQSGEGTGESLNKINKSENPSSLDDEIITNSETEQEKSIQESVKESKQNNNDKVDVKKKNYENFFQTFQQSLDNNSNENRKK